MRICPVSGRCTRILSMPKRSNHHFIVYWKWAYTFLSDICNPFPSKPSIAFLHHKPSYSQPNYSSWWLGFLWCLFWAIYLIPANFHLLIHKIIIITKDLHPSSLLLVTYALNATPGRPWVPRFFTLKIEPARGCAAFSSAESLALKKKKYKLTLETW